MISRLKGLILFLALVPVPAGAQCAAVDVDVPKSFRDTDLVFRGILVRNESEARLTFQADRIWKGSTGTRDIVVYEVGTPASESDYRFKVGEQYLIFAKVLSAGDRIAHGVGPDDPAAFGFPRACGAPPWPLRLTRELDRISKSKRPRR